VNVSALVRCDGVNIISVVTDCGVGILPSLATEMRSICFSRARQAVCKVQLWQAIILANISRQARSRYRRVCRSGASLRPSERRGSNRTSAPTSVESVFKSTQLCIFDLDGLCALTARSMLAAPVDQFFGFDLAAHRPIAIFSRERNGDQQGRRTSEGKTSLIRFASP
jgi:hypothetical protein